LQNPDLVEQLHKDKSIEDQGVVLGGALYSVGAGDTKELISKEHQPVHHCQLVHTLPYYVLGNLQHTNLSHLAVRAKSAAQDESAWVRGI